MRLVHQFYKILSFYFNEIGHNEPKMNKFHIKMCLIFQKPKVPHRLCDLVSSRSTLIYINKYSLVVTEYIFGWLFEWNAMIWSNIFMTDWIKTYEWLLLLLLCLLEIIFVVWTFTKHIGLGECAIHSLLSQSQPIHVVRFEKLYIIYYVSYYRSYTAYNQIHVWITSNIARFSCSFWFD